MATTFPTKEEFNVMVKNEEDGNRYFSFSKLAVNTIYHIDGWKRADGKFGGGIVLKLTKEDGVSVNVWATPLLLAKLNLDKEELSSDRYIRPLGLKVCKTDTAKNYHAFDLIGGQEEKKTV
jgi:hypothetical protein